MLADEAGRSLYEELDFRVEASNAAEFRRAHAYMPFIAGGSGEGWVAHKGGGGEWQGRWGGVGPRSGRIAACRPPVWSRLGQPPTRCACCNPASCPWRAAPGTGPGLPFLHLPHAPAAHPAAPTRWGPPLPPLVPLPVPGTMWRYTTRHVLVSEWVDGRSPTQLLAAAEQELAESAGSEAIDARK